MSVILALLQPYWQQIIGVVLGALALGGAFFKVRSDGKAAARAERAVEDLKSEKEVSDAKDRMAGEVARGPDPRLTDERLRGNKF